jgi:lipopolysaccharide export system protein LptA
MIYNDSLKIATVTDSVNIRRGNLHATCEKVDYFTDENMAILRINPVIYYEKHRIIGDSVDLFFGSESLESARVVGNTHGFYSEVDDSSNDTTITHIWSDSLHLTMFESGRISVIKAFGNARGSYSEISASSGSATTTDITSDSLHMFMFESGRIRAMKAFGNAHGSYSEVTALSGNARTTDITSDSLHVFMFESGRVRAMKAFGGSHGRNAEWSAPTAAAPAPRDSAITHIWSDSLRVMMAEDGKIRTMRALGNVHSKNFFLGDSTRANQVTGNTMTLGFNETGRIDRAVIRGNARSLYFLDESDGGGTNVTEGDRIVVTFSGGKAQRLRVIGNVRGVYSP